MQYRALIDQRRRTCGLDGIQPAAHLGFDQSVQFSLLGGRKAVPAVARRTPRGHQFGESSLLVASEKFVGPLVLHNNQRPGLCFGQQCGEGVERFARRFADGLPPASDGAIANLARLVRLRKDGDFCHGLLVQGAKYRMK